MTFGWFRYNPRVKALGSLLPLVLAAACASDDHEIEMPDVTVKAAEETSGTRITFHLHKGEISDKPIVLEPDFGELRDFVRSNDLRTCSVLWVNGNGKLTCKFPYGQTGEFILDETEVLQDRFLYTFLVAPGATVTSHIARGAPILPRLLVRVSLDEKNRPATLQWEGRRVQQLTRKNSLLLLELPRNRETNVLETGDWTVTLRTPVKSYEFLVGIDPDGSPTAVSGTVRRAD